MKRLLLAWRFLTRFPAGAGTDFTEQELAGSLVWFPAVGLGLGLILVGLNRVFESWLPGIVGDILLVWILIYLTRGLHLDGFMDVMDGLYAGDTSQKALTIMHDSRVGAMAVIGVTGLLLLKVFALNAFNHPQKDMALLLIPMLGRWGMSYGACMYKYVSDSGSGGTGRIFVEQNDLPQFLMASILPVIVTLSLIKLAGVWLIGLIFLSSAALYSYLNRRLAGINGDCLGAAEELMEALALVFILILV